MNRRTFLISASGAVVSQIVGRRGNSHGIAPQLLTAQVNLQHLAQVITTQQCPEWCWAACISMLFDYYGHPVSQAKIVTAAYGNVICLPSGYNIAQDISRSYIDDNGNPFTSLITAAFDSMHRVNSMDNRYLVNSLKNNNPLLYCNTHHAMIVYGVDYYEGIEPNIQAVHVIDPWPPSPRAHLLTLPEMVAANNRGEMTFLASISLF